LFYFCHSTVRYLENHPYTSATTKKTVHCSERLQLKYTRQLVSSLCLNWTDVHTPFRGSTHKVNREYYRDIGLPTDCC